LNAVRLLPKNPSAKIAGTDGHSITMSPDESIEDPARKETQEFDPSLVDEEGIHPEPREEESSAVLKRSPRYQGLEDKPDKNESWHAFKTP
jgi:hypothetical protein